MLPVAAAISATTSAPRPNANVFDVLGSLDATSQDTLLRTFPRATLRDVRISCSAGRAFVDRQVTALCLDYASVRSAAAAAGPNARSNDPQQQRSRESAPWGSGRGGGRGSARGRRGQGGKRGPRAGTNSWGPDDEDGDDDNDGGGGHGTGTHIDTPGTACAGEPSVQRPRQLPTLQHQLAAALPRWDRLTALTVVLRPGRSPELSGRAPDVTAALLQPLGCSWEPGLAGSSCSAAVLGAAAQVPAPAAVTAGAEAVPSPGSCRCGDGQANGAQRVLGSVERLAVWFEGTLRGPPDSAGAYGQGGRRGGRRGRGGERGHQPQPLPLPPPSLGPALVLAFPGLRCLDLSIRRWSDAAWVWTGASATPPPGRPGPGSAYSTHSNSNSSHSHSGPSGTTCPLVAALAGLPRLEELRVPSAAVLADVAGLTRLTALHVTARRGALGPGSAAALAGLPRLRRLVLAGEARRGTEQEQGQAEVEVEMEAGEAGGRAAWGAPGMAAGKAASAGAGAAAAAASLAGAWMPASGGSSAAGNRGGSGGGGGGGPEERLLRADVAALLPQELLRLLRSPPPALQQLHFTELTGMPPNSGLLIGPPMRRGGSSGGGGGGGNFLPSGTPAWPRSTAGSSGGGAGGRFGSGGGYGGSATVAGAAAWEVAAQAQADAARGPNAAARLSSTGVGLALGFGARASSLAAGPGSGNVAVLPWADAAAASAAAAAAEQCEAAAVPRVVTVAYAEGRTWMGPLGFLAAAAMALAEGLREQCGQQCGVAAAEAAGPQPQQQGSAATPDAAAAVENFVVRDLWVMPGRRGMPLSDDVRAAHRLMAELRRRYGCVMTLRHVTASFGIELDDTTYLLEEVGARLGAPAAVSLTDLDLYDLEAAPPALTYQLQQQLEARQAAAAAAAVAQLGLPTSSGGGGAAGARGPATGAAAPRRRRHSDGALGPVSHAAVSRAAALVHYLRTVFGRGAGNHHSPPAAPRLGVPHHHLQALPANPQHHHPYHHQDGAASPASTASGGGGGGGFSYDMSGPPPLPPPDQQLSLLALNGCTGLGVDVAAQLAAVLPGLRRLSVGFSLPPQDGAVLGHLCELLAVTTVGRGGAGAGEPPLVVGVCPRPTGRSGRRGGGSQAERQELLAEMNSRLEGMGAGGRVRVAWAMEDEAAEQLSEEQAKAAEGRAGCKSAEEGGEREGEGERHNGNGGSFDGCGASEDDGDEEAGGGERGEAGPPVSRWWAW